MRGSGVVRPGSPRLIMSRLRVGHAGRVSWHWRAYILAGSPPGNLRVAGWSRLRRSSLRFDWVAIGSVVRLTVTPLGASGRAASSVAAAACEYESAQVPGYSGGVDRPIERIGILRVFRASSCRASSSAGANDFPIQDGQQEID